MRSAEYPDNSKFILPKEFEPYAVASLRSNSIACRSGANFFEGLQRRMTSNGAQFPLLDVRHDLASYPLTGNGTTHHWLSNNPTCWLAIGSALINRVCIFSAGNTTTPLQEKAMRLRRNQLCPIHRSPLFVVAGKRSREKNASAGVESVASTIPNTHEGTERSARMRKCESCWTGRLSPKTERVQSATKSSPTTPTSYPTTSVPAA